MSAIHPTAFISEGARLGAGVSVGPYCTVGPDVVLGDGVSLVSHVVIAGYTTLGPGCQVYPFASLGMPPPDRKYRGEPSTVQVGADVIIREYVTIHPGTEADKMTTRVGDRCLLMQGTHVAHDCIVGHDVVMANGATLGGHVEIGDCAVLGGLCAVQQRARIGEGAMIAGKAGITNDVIPFGLALGDRAHLEGLNVVGLKRRGVGSSELKALRQVYREVFESAESTFAARLAGIGETLLAWPTVQRLMAFLQASEHRALCRPQRQIQQSDAEEESTIPPR